MVKQTGKAMPIQFSEYVSRQIAAHIQKKDFTASGNRVIDDNEYVDEAKKWYCKTIGYGQQKKACNACWLDGQCEVQNGFLKGRNKSEYKRIEKR